MGVWKRGGGVQAASKRQMTVRRYSTRTKPGGMLRWKQTMEGSGLVRC